MAEVDIYIRWYYEKRINISLGSLSLVEYRKSLADDPHILDTVKAIDYSLRAELPQGALWYRYTGDGYGEHEGGFPFDGTGKGRPWPLLAGERAHYELAAGRPDTAEALLNSLERSAGTGVERDINKKTPSNLRIRRFNNQLTTIPEGKKLRLEVWAGAVVRWSIDGWASFHDTNTFSSTLGTHFTDLTFENQSVGNTVVFTFFWQDAGHWEGSNFTVYVGG